MFIKSLEYSESPGDPRSWKVTGLDFGNINLIVGKNASGKSRVISALFGLAQIVAGRIPPKFSSGKWKVIFERTKGQMIEEQLYILELSGVELYLRRCPSLVGWLWREMTQAKVLF